MKWLIAFLLLFIFLLPGRNNRLSALLSPNHSSYTQQKLPSFSTKGQARTIYHTKARNNTTASPGKRKKANDVKAAEIDDDDEEVSVLVKKHSKTNSSSLASFYHQLLTRFCQYPAKQLSYYQYSSYSGAHRYILLCVIRI